MASETYEFLRKIVKGDEVNRWNYPDELIYDILHSKGKSPKIEIVFNNDDDFLEVLGIKDEEDRWTWSRFSGGYNDSFYDNYRYVEDWDEGYILRGFKGKNVELLNKILRFTNPKLYFNEGDDESAIKISNFLTSKFGNECENITYEWGRNWEECNARKVQEQLMDETNDPFRNFGIIQKRHAYKFVTSVNILLNLYKTLNAEDKDLKGMLTLLYETYGNRSIGDWYDLEYNVNCDDFDDEGFQNEVTRYLEQILEIVEVDFDGDNQEEYTKMYNKVMSLGGFNKKIKLPEKNIVVLFYDFKSNLNKLYFNLYKDTKTEKRSVNNLEDLNLQLYHPELFESVRRILKKLL